MPREQSGLVERSLPFTAAALEQGIKLGGCVVCQVLYQWEQRQLFTFLYEGMTDRPTYEKFQESGGFCARHFWIATHLGVNFWSVGNYELANLYRPLIRRARSRINSVSGADRRLKIPLLSSNKVTKGETIPPRDCWLCLEIENRDQQLVRVLEEFSDKLDMKEAVEKNGLCLSHGRAAARTWKRKEKRAWIKEVTSRVTDQLAHDADELVRKYDVRFQHEKIGPEADVVRRCMEFLIGLDCFLPPDKKISAGPPKSQ